MRKWGKLRRLKVIFIVTVTICLIVMMLCLPRIVAVLGDRMQLGQAGLGQMQSVQLDIKNELETLDKISLVQYEYLEQGIAIDEEDASMSREELNAAVSEALEPYYAVGLLVEFGKTQEDWNPMLVRDLQSVDRYAIFWIGRIVQQTKPNHTLELIIDDATGKLIYIHFEAGKWVNGELEIYEKAQLFAQVYFTNLGIVDYYENDRSIIEEKNDIKGDIYYFVNENSDVVSVKCLADHLGFYIEVLNDKNNEENSMEEK